MEHTYLRYECADTFGLTVSTGSSKAPYSKYRLAFLGSSRNAPLLTVSGSIVSAFNLKSCSIAMKIGHRELLPGGIGTGSALNSGEIVCLDVLADASKYQIATGWVDGAVRVFEVSEEEAESTQGLVRSLLHPNENEDFIRRDPLLLDGQTQSPIRCVKFDQDNKNRLAAGSSDGSVVLWDIVSESGLFRLIGHRGGITDLTFFKLPTTDGLISCSLDGLVKVWDLGAQCCIQTLANHRGEVWSLSLLRDENERIRLVTGGSDGRIRVWSVSQPSDEDKATDTKDDKDEVCRFMGSVDPPPNVATSNEKITSTDFHPSMRFFGVLHANAKTVDVYSVRSEKESQKRKARRLKRKQEKEKKKGKTADEEKKGQKRGILDEPDEIDEMNEVSGEGEALDPDALKASDEFEYLASVRCVQKISGFTFVSSKEKGELIRVVCSLTNNVVESYSIMKDGESKADQRVFETDRKATIEMYGHPTGVRAIALSSDDSLACTVSKNVTKIWNISNRSVVQSLSPGIEGSKAACYGLSAAFLPGNTHVVLGTREGHLLLIDIALGDVIYYEEKAHEGSIWSIDVRKNTNTEQTVTFLTGSADKSVKFWNVERDEEDESPILTHTRTLQLTDDVVCARYSYSLDPTKRMIFVSTIDSNIKVFFDDSLKLFLSLYGHKLPALCLDASDDDTILASGGADKSIKIWGLDFGDTHKTLHGHEDSITDLRFVKRSHNFFTASKDGTVRYWDGDRFEQILYLPGHFAEVNCLAVSRSGAFVLSGSMDRQVRVWERTRDIVFVEEEKERYLEMAFDRVDNRDEGPTATILDKGDDNQVDDDEPQSEAAVRKSLLSVAAGDRILEAIELADKETKDILNFKKIHGKDANRQSNMMMMGFSPAKYILWILNSIKSTELEQSLLMLPIAHVERLMFYLIQLLRAGLGIELCSKVAVFLIKSHQNQIITQKTLGAPIRELKNLIRTRLDEKRDVFGFDLAALKMIGRAAAERKLNRMDVDSKPQDIWEGLGLGSDVAAALEGRKKK